ncbi:MAG: hypothetical protein ACM3SW_16420 [Actinomycetota bacterium]
MAHTLRPLSLGKLLDETFDIYRHNFLLFVGISAVPNLVLLLLRLTVVTSVLNRPKHAELLVLVIALGAYVATLFVGSVVTAATTFGVSDIYLDRPTSIQACFARVGGKALRVAYVSFVVGLIVGFGMVLCLVPGIYWAGVYGVAIPAVVLENISGGESLRRSSDLTKDSVGRVIVVYFLTAIFAVIIAAGLIAGVDALGSSLFQHAGIFTMALMRQTINTLAATLFGPISAIALTLVYYDQRVRKEAFDIEHMMSLMPDADASATGASAS